MNDSDSELWRRFVEAQDEDSFNQLVERHVHAVYSTARRVVRHEHFAEEIVQDAFCLLARKGRSLPPGTILVAWLHRVTWHLAMKALRNELRRRQREQNATSIAMNTPADDSLWNDVAPLLDEAIESLNQAERQAVLLRFFERKPASEIGALLGVNEGAARMRLSRAVEKLRRFYARRGVACASTVLASLLASRCVQAAPPALLPAVQAAARLAAQSALPSSLILELFKLMAKIKLKTTVISGAALIFAVLAGRQLQQALAPDSDPMAGIGAVKTVSTNQVRSQAGSWLASLLSRTPADRAEAAEIAALRELRKILYSPERDASMPPDGIWQAVQASGSKRRAALDMMLEALKSPDQNAQHRAAGSLQFFREAAAEIVPELMSVFKNSKDAGLISYAAGSLAALNKPEADGIPAILAAFKENPAAAHGAKLWLDMFRFHHKDDDEAVVHALTPLLSSEKANEQWLAADVLARTSGRNDPRLVPILAPALEATELRSDHEIYAKSFTALEALKKIGPDARSAVDAIRAYGERLPQMRESVLDALAAVAPDLRAEIPELDARLKEREAAATLAQQTKNGEASVASLMDALQNGEARIQAVEKLGSLGGQAKEALPRLREILQSNDSDPRPDANNYLFAVATAIRAIDPDAPTYYRPEEFVMGFMDVTKILKTISEPAAQKLNEELEPRMFSPRPFDRDEIVNWLERIRSIDAQLGDSFARALRRSPSLSELETTDPALARALTP